MNLGDTRNSTVSISKNLNPEWNETMEFPVQGVQSLLLEVTCWDKDRIGKDYMVRTYEVAHLRVLTTVVRASSMSL